MWELDTWLLFRKPDNAMRDVRKIILYEYDGKIQLKDSVSSRFKNTEVKIYIQGSNTKPVIIKIDIKI